MENNENLINQDVHGIKPGFHLLGTFSGKVGDLTVTILKTGPWSFEDDFFLIHSLKERSHLKAVSEIAKVLKRGVKACRDRYKEINPHKKEWSYKEKRILRTFTSPRDISSQIDIARILYEKCGIVRSLEQINSYLQVISS